MSGEPTIEQNVDLLIKRLLLKDLRTQLRNRKLSPAGGRDQLADRLKEDMLSRNDFSLMDENGKPMEEALVTQMFGVQSVAKGNNFTRPEGQNVGNFLGDRPSSRVLAAPGGASNFSLSHGGGSSTAAPAVEAPAAPAALHISEAPKPTGAKLSFLDKMTAKIAGSPGKAPPPAAPVSQVNPNVADAPAYDEEPAIEEGFAAVEITEGNAPSKSFNNSGIKQNNYSRPSGQNVGNFLTDKPSSRVLAPPGGGSSVSFG